MTNEYEVNEIGLNRIWSDNEFNCRGVILPMDVIDLVKDIEKNGLQFPIAIQPETEIEEKVNYDFRIIAGHRRFQAYKVLKKDTIPAMIKTGLNEVQARLLNLGENLMRQDLIFFKKLRPLKN